ncbi:hypothetical protein KY284_008135 [Solanum tuberosum]|nr:hypothetical protein KY284_008135 [Solanum tuberosum]
MRRLQQLHMGFIFQDPSECNVSVVWEFYANWKPDARSHFVTVRGVEVPLTPVALNQLLGTIDAPSDVLTGINNSPLYQQIRHALYVVQSTAKWIQHRHRGYHQAYPYAHMNREAQDLPINVGAVLKLAMRKARASWSSKGECGLHGASVHHTPRCHKDKGAGEHAWAHPHHSRAQPER